MKVLHILEDFSLNSGGIRTVVKELNQRLNKNQNRSYILSSDKEDDDYIYLVNTRRTPWRYSKNWHKTINNIHKEFNIDVIHIHGVWMYPQLIACKFAKKNNIPFLISIHGMYEPWLWKKGRFKKTMYFKLLAKPIFKKANVIHAITNEEKNNLKKLFPKAKIKVIPNLIDNKANVKLIREDNEKYILFVGRLDPKKGIDLLIKAFAKLNLPAEWKLKIAGNINEYKTELDNITKKLNIKEKVEFLGIVKGTTKEKLFLNAHVFVAPSFSEVIGMVNLEAAILKTPVITTYQTGLNKDWNLNGGILINPNTEELNLALIEATSWDTEERNKKGQMLYNFVLKHYSWINRFKDWETLYKNLKNATD